MKMMKHAKLFYSLTLTATLAFAAAGCKSPTYLTNLPGNKPPRPGDQGLADGSKIPSPKDMSTSPTAAPGGGELSENHIGWNEDKEALKSQTVYFDYDKSAIKSSEQSKLEAVASYLRAHPAAAVRIEGNCDSRGTEEYNRSLGERRALAGREVLVGMGISPGAVDTKSWGEDNPDNVPGTGESAYSKNRRDDFIVLTAPK